MSLKLVWHEPITLKEGRRDNLIYSAEGLEEWEGVAGVYMFARMFGRNVTPLYVGRAENLALRVREDFKTNVQLMNKIRAAGKGEKVVIFGKFVPRQGQNTRDCIGRIERVLIDYLRIKGCSLFNVKGARTPLNTIVFYGYTSARKITGKRLSYKEN